MVRLAANLTMLYNELDFLDRFAAAAKSGFKGVEYLFPYAYRKEQLAERLDRHGLKQVLHNLPAGVGRKASAVSRAIPRAEANSRMALREANIKLLIEPINTFDIPGFFLSRTAQALDIMRDVGSPNLFLQYDIYHMQRMEGELANQGEPRANRASPLADNPGRNDPGTGEINYRFLFDFIDRIGYEGWIGCEYKPKANTVDGLSWRGEHGVIS